MASKETRNQLLGMQGISGRGTGRRERDFDPDREEAEDKKPATGLALVSEAGKDYVGVYVESGKQAVVNRVFTEIGLLPRRSDIEGRIDERRGLGRRIARWVWGDQTEVDRRVNQSQNPFVRQVTETINSAQRTRRNPDRLFQIGSEFLGSDEILNLQRVLDTSQLDPDPEVRENERMLAIHLKNDTEAGEVSEPTRDRWFGIKINEMFRGVIRSAGKTAVDFDEYDTLDALVENPTLAGDGETREIVMVEVPRKHSFLAALFGAKGFSPEVFLGNKTTVTINQEGRIVVRKGQERNTIAEKPESLLVDTDIPDGVESLVAVTNGDFGTEKWQGLIKKIVGKREDVVDLGTLVLQRSGAGEQVAVPVLSISEASKQVRGFLKTFKRAFERLEDMERDQDSREAVNAYDEEELKTRVRLRVTNDVRLLPRQTIVEEQADQLMGQQSRRDAQDRTLLAGLGVAFDIPQDMAREYLDMDQEARNRIRTTLVRRAGGDEAVADKAMAAISRRARKSVASRQNP